MERLLEFVPEKLHEVFAAIVGLTDDFCDSHLSRDYRQLARDMAVEICQNGLPVKKGRPKSWACGIIHALGWVNFLADPSFEPYMSVGELAERCGVSEGTMASKSKIIRDGLNIMPMDPEWCLPELLEKNPLVWMLEVNGLVMDIRTAPRDIQEAAYAEGLIPFIPSDEAESGLQLDEDAKILKFPTAQGKSPKPGPAKKPEYDGPTLF
ncbi:MAG: hypothetical protein DRP65_10160 [Planctomycetota bacterium]|nr:MAG: hypothetical protein DRP65_10160 [Planctomycetota bacterium]